MGLAINNNISKFEETESVLYSPQSWDYNEDVVTINEINPKQIISYDQKGMSIHVTRMTYGTLPIH